MTIVDEDLSRFLTISDQGMITKEESGAKYASKYLAGHQGAGGQ